MRFVKSEHFPVLKTLCPMNGRLSGALTLGENIDLALS